MSVSKKKQRESLNETGQPEHQKITGCIRKMSRCERMFFMSPACTVMMAARITGRVDENQLRQALDAARRKHPLLGAKIVFDDRYEAYFSSDAVPPVPLRVIPRESDRHWLDALKKEARVPFDLGTGPLVRCVLLQSPEVSDLLVFCNHSICDGMALAGLVRDLLSLYEDSVGEVRARDPPDVMEILKPGFSIQGIFGRLIARSANRKWRKSPHYFGPAEYSNLYRAYWEDRMLGVVLFEFDRAESARLQAVCREHGITVGSAVSAACLGAYADVTGGFPKSQRTIMVPFDVRRWTDPPVGEVFCFCVGALQLPFTYSPQKPFWENAELLHRAIHSRLEGPAPVGPDIPPFEPSLIDALSAFGPFADRIPKTYTYTETLQRFIRDTSSIAFTFTRNFEKGIPGFIPSNLGRVDLPESSGDLRLDRLIFLPSASEINPLLLGGIGAGGRMIFALPFVDPPAKTGISPEPEMIRIRNRALELLGFPEKVHLGAIE